MASANVGLVSGACFVCVDKVAERISALNRVPIFEPGLHDLIVSNARQGRLAFASELAPAVAAAEGVFIAVGTPSRRGDGHADLSYVNTAAKEIAAALDGFTVIITKSTVPVGAGDEVDRIIRAARPDADFAAVSNPEFLREAAIQDFKHPDRIVAGTDEDRARIPALQDMGTLVRDFDPSGWNMQKQFFQMSSIVIADGSDGVVIVTEWEQFRALDFNLMKHRMACPLLVNLRNICTLAMKWKSTASCMWELEEKMPSMLCGFEPARTRSGDRNLLSEEGIQRSGGLTT